MKKILAFTFDVFMLASCQEAANPSNLPPISFSARAPIRLNIAQVTVSENYRSSGQAPYVEHTLTTSPASGIKQWANERIIASGQAGKLDIAIDDASVQEVPLPKTDGVKGFFTDDQSERYDARLSVTLRLYDGVNPTAMAESSILVTRSRSINEKATVVERDKLFHDMVSDMLSRYDAESEIRLRTYFTNYII